MSVPSACSWQWRTSQSMRSLLLKIRYTSPTLGWPFVSLGTRTLTPLKDTFKTWPFRRVATAANGVITAGAAMSTRGSVRRSFTIASLLEKRPYDKRTLVSFLSKMKPSFMSVKYTRRSNAEMDPGLDVLLEAKARSKFAGE